MRTRSIALGLAFAGMAVAAAPAAAQDPVTVEATEFEFTPPSVTVVVGQAVRFTNAGGSHNVHFVGEAALFAPGLPAAPDWLAGPSKTFSTAGEYRFVCDPHANRGMTARVVVQAPAVPPTPGPSPGPAPEPQPVPGTPGPSSNPTPEPGAPAVDAPAAATIRRLGLARKQFCTRPGRSCRRPGVVLRVDLTAQGELAGSLEHRPLGRGAAFRAFGRLELGAVPAGARSVRFSRTTSGRRLTPGRYRLRVTLDGQAARTLRFVVRDS